MATRNEKFSHSLAFFTAALVCLIAASQVEAATVSSDSKTGATWTGFSNGVPDLSNADYLDALTNPFTVGTGSTVLSGVSAPLTATGLTVLNNGVGSTVNSQTVILNTDGFVRLMVDLQAGAGNSVFVEEFNSYGMVTSDPARNYQIFDLYGSNDPSNPAIDGDPVTNGWELIANVNETSFDTVTASQTNGVHIDEIDEQFRYLLFHATTPQNFRGNHFVELDVVGTVEAASVVPEPISITIWSILGVCVAFGAWRRRQL